MKLFVMKTEEMGDIYVFAEAEKQAIEMIKSATDLMESMSNPKIIVTEVTKPHLIVEVGFGE
jgi:hypothetical protein